MRPKSINAYVIMTLLNFLSHVAIFMIFPLLFPFPFKPPYCSRVLFLLFSVFRCNTTSFLCFKLSFHLRENCPAILVLLEYLNHKTVQHSLFFRNEMFLFLIILIGNLQLYKVQKPLKLESYRRRLLYE